jgi:osmotically-inducible protein OsmY
MRHHQYQLALLVGCSAVAIVSAQQPPHPALPPEVSAPEAREPVNVSDAQLGLEVQSRLNQTLEVSNLSALVRYGIATLKGSVRTEEDRRRAEQVALEVHGVETVLNEIAVESPVVIALAEDAQALQKRETSDIEMTVADKLRLDPVLGSRDIRVVVDEVGNTATLTGTVSTEEEKEQAGKIAVTAFPNGRIRNQLEVQQRL